METKELNYHILEFIDVLETSMSRCISAAKHSGQLPLHDRSEEPISRNRFTQELLRHRSLHQARVIPDRRPYQVAFDSENAVFEHFGRFRLEWKKIRLRLGEITAVIGANAAGKTTLLRIVAGNLALTSGQIQYPPFKPNSNWYSAKQNIAYIPQSGSPWDGRMLDNLRFEAASLGRLGRDNDDDVEFITHRLRLDAFTNCYWQELSGGYKARFELARALLREPRLLILDEPLAHLDPNAQSSFLQDLVDLTRRDDLPVATILSSQHLHEVEAVADKIIFVNNGEIEFFGTPSELARTRTTQQFEISCSFSPDRLRTALEPIKPIEFHEGAVSCSVVLPKSESGSSLLTILLAQGAVIYYFRDVTQSTKRLFK
jgi:ABC-2 type transport system ATP-binding protein